MTRSHAPVQFPLASCIWLAKVPPKIKAIICLMILEKRLKINDLYLVCRPHKALCPTICVMCKQNKIMRHALINFYIVMLLRDCRTLNLVFRGRSGCLTSVEDLFLTRFIDIRERKDAKMLLEYPTFYVLLGDLNAGNA